MLALSRARRFRRVVLCCWTVSWSAVSPGPIVALGGPVPVSEFYAEGMVPAAVNEHCGSELAVQIEYALRQAHQAIAP
jgi:hypothetical protein